MKALSLLQPWATLIAIGAKSIETRTWKTPYRGPIAIHASKGFPPWCRQLACSVEPFRSVLPAHGLTIETLPCGAILATATLARIVPVDFVMSAGGAIHFQYDKGKPRDVTISEDELAFGDYSPGRFAWVLIDVRPLAQPISMRGSLGLWEWNHEGELIYAAQ
jgi:hypothetical protein